MIQEMTTGIFHNGYSGQLPREGDQILFVKGRSVLMKDTSETIVFMCFEEVPAKMSYRYLFQIEIGDRMLRFFLGEADKLPEQAMEGYSYQHQGIFRIKGPDHMAFAGITACQLADWYMSTQSCSRCSAALVHDAKERMMRCPSCGAVYYPKISPAVIVGVIDREKERLLLTRYAGRDYKKYALIAGFTEIGETAEDTVRREVMEEVGLKVKNIRYYKSQPWSFTDTLLLGFYCELDGDDRITLDREELATGEWLGRDEIPTTYDGISLTNEMIMRFKDGKE